jgi:hypothetical protein
MNGFLTILIRELRERRLIALAALLAGLGSLAAPLLPGVAHLQPSEVRAGSALGLAVILTSALALLLGGSIIARDLAERRLGFYFARPLSGWAIWGGKLAAALVLTLGAGLLVLLPAGLLGDFDLSGGGSFPNPLGESLPAVAGTGAFVLLFLLLAAHAVSVIVRARSPWLVLDLLGACGVFLLLLHARDRLFYAGAFGTVLLLGLLALVLALLALLAASATQVLRGRTDLRRGHRTLSLTLWGVLLATGLATEGAASWILNVTPRDLTQGEVLAVDPAGSWIAVAGPAAYRRGFHPTFLLDAASGRFERTRISALADPGRLLFASGGGRAVWVEPRGPVSTLGMTDLVSLDLRDPQAVPRRTNISYPDSPYRLALSADGRRVAAASDGRLVIDEVETGRLLAAIDLSGNLRYPEMLRFASPTRVLLYQHEVSENPGDLLQSRLEIHAAEVGGRLTRVGETDGGRGFFFWRMSPDNRRFLTRGTRGGPLRAHDAGNGAVLAERPMERGFEATFLADGRIALVQAGEAWRELLLLAPDLTELRRFRFDGARTLAVGGQPAPDRLTVATSAQPENIAEAGDYQARVLDLATGGSRVLGDGLLPVPFSKAGPKSAGPTLFRTAGGGLVRIDLATGERRVLVAGKS